MDTENSKLSWLGYGAEILTVFFALIVLAGRVYAQNYWHVFGLSAQIIDNNFINYAIMSPNVAIASVIIALGSIFMVSIFRQPGLDHFTGTNSKALSTAGFVFFWIGFFFVGFTNLIDTSGWTLGTPGLLFGLAYLSLLGGFYVWMTVAIQADVKNNTKIIAALGWLRTVPFIIVQIFFIIIFAGISIWGIMETAQKFGTNEAKEEYNAKPFVNLQLDSAMGFQGFVLQGTSTLHVKIIAESEGFFYVSPGIVTNPAELIVLAIPLSRVQSIQYNVGATPIGQ